MEHIAIMKKSWRLTQKILRGEKTIESRWYRSRRVPWDRIQIGDVVYFKDSGESVTIKAKAIKVLQFSGLDPKKVKEILIQYGSDDGIEKNKILEYYNRFKNKKYCILIFLSNPKKIIPFEINKIGFGAMVAWITVNDVERIKKEG